MQPVVGLLLCRQNFAAAHPRRENCNPIFAGLVPARLSQSRPEIGFGQVGRHASARPIVRAQSRLGQDVPSIGGLGKPANGLGVILIDLFSCRVARAQSELGGRVALLRQLPQTGQVVDIASAGRLAALAPLAAGAVPERWLAPSESGSKSTAQSAKATAKTKVEIAATRRTLCRA